MPTIPRFDRPAFLSDAKDVPGHQEIWSQYISDSFDKVIEDVEGEVGAGKSQYYNETKVSSDDPEDLDIVWDGFPKTLTRMLGRARALGIADDPSTDGAPFEGFASRIQDEYCEWRVTRDQDTQKIVRVVFTCEGPEYWNSIAGGRNIYGADLGNGDKDLLLHLYRTILGNEDVLLEDLFFPEGYFVGIPGLEVYNPYNKWNTTHGIVHLQQVNNNLGAEIRIGGEATVRRVKGGSEITDATQFVCCGGFGGINRSSDPTMGDEISKLAREGWALTLRNPVGIYFNSFNSEGITKPGPNNSRLPAGNYWRPLRGVFDPDAADPGDMTNLDTMVVRAVYEVPAGEIGPDGVQLTVSDLHIGGAPITFGGHLAEQITMKFIARRTRKESFDNEPVSCRNKCCRRTLPNGNRILVRAELADSCEDVFPILDSGPALLQAAKAVDLAEVPVLSRRRSDVL